MPCAWRTLSFWSLAPTREMCGFFRFLVTKSCFNRASNTFFLYPSKALGNTGLFGIAPALHPALHGKLDLYVFSITTEV